MKHVEKYYQEICSQYKEMIDNIKDLEEEVQSGIVEPERIERLKDQVAPIKQNYERWAYMMFLLRTPNRKEKLAGYKKRNQKLLKSLSPSNSLEGVIQENAEALKHVGD